jgi:hypothetical protein
VEFIYVHEGEGSAIIDQAIYPFKPGSLMYFQTFQLHRGKAKIPETGSYIRSKLLLEPSVLKSYMEQFTILQRFFLYLRQSNLDCQVIQVADPSQFDVLFQLYCPRDTELMNTEAFALFFMLFLTTLKDQWTAKNQADKESNLHLILSRLADKNNEREAASMAVSYRQGFSDSIRFIMQALSWEPSRR